MFYFRYSLKSSPDRIDFKTFYVPPNPSLAAFGNILSVPRPLAHSQTHGFGRKEGGSRLVLVTSIFLNNSRCPPGSCLNPIKLFPSPYRPSLLALQVSSSPDRPTCQEDRVVAQSSVLAPETGYSRSNLHDSFNNYYIYTSLTLVLVSRLAAGGSTHSSTSWVSSSSFIHPCRWYSVYKHLYQFPSSHPRLRHSSLYILGIFHSSLSL